MAEIQVDVTLPSATSVDVTSPTQALAANVIIPGPQGPRGLPLSLNNITSDYITITGQDGNYVYTGLNTIYISGNSGYFQSAINTLTTNLNLTGANLNTSINNLSGLFTGYTGSLDATYATDSQLQETGSSLVNSINSLSGTLTSTYATITNLALTGSTLQTQINDLGNTYATDAELTNVQTNLNNKITSLSGDAVLLKGDQIIQGQKTFTGSNVLIQKDLYVYGSGYFPSGIKIGTDSVIINGNTVLVNNNPVALTSELSQTGTTIYNTIGSLSGSSVLAYGEQTIEGIKNFSGTNVAVNILSGASLTVSGNPVLTGVDLSPYATNSNLALTGSTLQTQINNLDNTYATDIALASTGNTLQTQINNLGTTYATVTNLALTGSTLENKIGSLSGTLTSDYATIINLASTGTTLQNYINSLSGSSVLLYGNQTIDGTKTFRDKVYIHDLYVTGTEFIANVQNNFIESPYILLNLTGGATDGGIFFVTGSGLTGINDLGPIIGFDHTNKFKFGISSRGSDLSTLNDIAAFQDITAYSGFVNNKYATIINLASTGSTLQNQIDNLGNTYATVTNLALTGSTLESKIVSLSGSAVLLYGNQTISGDKTFAQNISVSGTGSFNGLNLDNINSLTLSGMNINITGNSILNIFNRVRISGNDVLTGVTQDSRAVLTTNVNQTILGVKTFSNIVTNLIDGVDTASPTVDTPPLIISGGNNFYPQKKGADVNIVGGFKSGVINLLSPTNINGDVNVTGNILLSGNQVLTGSSTLYATSTNLASTGSTLNTRINNLSGYINSTDSNIVFTTGNQSIAGNKSFYGDMLLSGENNRIGQYHYIETDSDFVFIRYENGISALNTEERNFRSTDGAESLNWENRFLVDANNNTSLHWNERYLANQNETPVLYWTGDNIGIGTNTPSEKLEVAGNIKFGDVENGYSAKFIMWDPANGVYNTGDWYDSQLTLTDSKNNKSIALNFYGDTNSLISNGSILRLPSGKDDFIAMDSEVVHITGNEIISGTKIFNENISGAFISGTYINAGLTSAWDSGPRNGYFLGNGHSIRAVDTSNGIGFYSAVNSYPRFLMAASTLRMGANGALLWNTTNDVVTPTSTTDVGIYRDAANILAQRNGTNAQQLRIYNSTGTNSGEFALLGWQNNELVIGAQATNSGILRPLVITGDSISYSGKRLTIAHTNAGLFFDATGPTIRGNHWGASDAGFITYRNGLDMGRGGAKYLRVDSMSPTVVVGNAASSSYSVGIGFDGTNSNLSSPDVFILRDQANILAQRNGTSAQQFRVYNVTGTNSGEFGLVGWQNNQLVIGSQATNSGVLRNVIITGNNVLISGLNFKVDSLGSVSSYNGTSTNIFSIYNNYGFGFANSAGGFYSMQGNGFIGLGGFMAGQNGFLGFGATTHANGFGQSQCDLILTRDAADILGQRRGTNPQQFRIYNSTGTNSGEFGLFGWQNNNLIIGSQATNSGVLRDLTLTGNNININASGVFNIFDDTNILGNLNVTGNTTFTARPTLNGTGFLLSGEAANVDLSSTVQITGDQNISGNKTFLNNIQVSGTGIFNAIDLNNIDNLSLSGVDITITSGVVALTNRPTVNGTGVLLSGEAAQVDLSTTVRTTGDQTINGIKTFASRPTVNSTGILLSGETAPKDIGTTINISSNTISLDLSVFSYFLVNLNSNITTVNFNNPKAAPEVTNFVLQLSGDGTIRSVTWPTSLRWPGSAAPTITIGPNKVDTYSIFSYDGGVNYYGFPAGYNS